MNHWIQPFVAGIWRASSELGFQPLLLAAKGAQDSRAALAGSILTAGHILTLSILSPGARINQDSASSRRDLPLWVP